MSQFNDTDTVEFELPAPSLPVNNPYPKSAAIRIEFGAASHVGLVRENNEDAYLIHSTNRTWEKIATNLPDDELPNRYEERGYILMVADGMGGVAGGERASNLAIRTCVNLCLDAVKWTLKLDDPTVRDEEIREGIERALGYFRQIDRTVAEDARVHPEYEGMGTTLTVCYSVGADLFVFHVGDSRCYLLRNGKFTQLTHDHTIAQELADIGVIDAEEAAQHRLRHVLTKSIGSRAGRIEAEVQQLRLYNGDRIMMCSDGLTDMVTDEAITTVLTQTQSSQQACDQLIQCALDAGGKDNVTVLVAGYTIPE
ncbi:MAG: PP2C family protein-serine/threonine phosphatase [Gemmataceae bacterium]